MEFDKDKTYKIDTKESFYTATIIDSDEYFIKIKDKFDTEITLSKSEIKRIREAR